MTSLTSSWLSWLVFIAFTACIGGAFVFLGLWIENSSDKKWYLNVNDLRWQKLKSKIGWWILMMGIAVEIVTAGIFAVRGELEMRDNPLNLPVSDISATVVIAVAGTNFNEAPMSSPVVAWLELNTSTLDMADFSGLIADDFHRFNHVEFSSHAVTYHGYVLKFYPNPVPPFKQDFQIAGAKTRPTPKQIMEKIKVLRFYVNLIPKDAEVIGGSVELVMNGSFHEEFQISRQKTDKGLSTWNPNDTGFFLYATNSTPSP